VTAPPPAPPPLRLEQVEVVYHHVITAVQGVTLEVGPAAIVALLGTNGASKTTTLRAISGFLGADDARITDGRVLYEGRVVNGWAPHALARAGLVLVPERDKIFQTLTVHDNLRALVAGRRGGITLEQVWTYFPILAERRRQLAGYLSGGERQMLAIGAALLCQPRVLLIDELSFGLAPLVVEHLTALVGRLRDELGLAILLVEQNAAAALAIADHGYVLEHGRIVFDGPPATLAAHEDIQEFYLGVARAPAHEAGDASARRRYTAVKQYRRRRRWF
jgi:branched-chain amino acid transport system ATP-binding protein